MGVPKLMAMLVFEIVGKEMRRERAEKLEKGRKKKRGRPLRVKQERSLRLEILDRSLFLETERPLLSVWVEDHSLLTRS